MITFQLAVFGAHYHNKLINHWEVKRNKRKIKVEIDGLSGMPRDIRMITIDGVQYEGGNLREVPDDVYHHVTDELFRIRKKLEHASKERHMLNEIFKEGQTEGWGWIFKPVSEGSQILEGVQWCPDYAENCGF